jgi:hypothetical protein
MIDKLRRTDATVHLKEIVFDLSHVEMLGPQWTVVLALLIAFARGAVARCRVVSLHGQPAGVLGLHRHNRDVAALVSDQATLATPSPRTTAA